MAPASPLLVRLPNWVGDVVIALPILDALCKAGFELTLAGRAWCGDLLAAYPLPRVAMTRNHLSAARRLRRLEIRHGLLLTRSFGSALEARLAGMRVVGYRAEGRSWLLYRSLGKGAGDHILDYYWRLGRLACGAFGGDPEPFAGAPGTPLLRLTAEDRDRASAALAGAAVEAPFQVWCPLAANTIHGHSKVWPHFGELCRRGLADGVRVVCCPGPGQEEQARAALPEAVSLEGLGLAAMAGVMERACFVLANDTGPMHVAAAVRAPVLGLFGPGNDPGRTGPVGGSTLGGGDAWPDLETVLAEVRRHART